MKKSIGVLLALFAVSAVFAAPVFRADVTGTRKEGKVKIEPVQGTNMKANVPGFRSEADRPYCVNAYSNTLKAGEWTDCVFSFKAADDGLVNIELGGQWAKEADGREWILIGPVTVNGEALPNSDYAQTVKDSKGKTVPGGGYWLTGKAELKADAGPDGKGAIHTNHDNRLGRSIKVEAGKTYTVSVKVMPAK